MYYLDEAQKSLVVIRRWIIGLVAAALSILTAIVFDTFGAFFLSAVVFAACALGIEYVMLRDAIRKEERERVER